MSETRETVAAWPGIIAGMYWSAVASPLGELFLAGDENALVAVHMEDQRHRPPQDRALVRDDDRLAGAAHQLAEYFAGDRSRFAVDLTFGAASPFERCVWQELMTIPYGETTTYGELARRIGRPRAARAVGRANGRNPLAIVVPCHRVIGSGGDLTGYGGGLGRKRWLLDLERRCRP